MEPPTVSTKGLILAIDAGADSNCMSSGDTSCTNMVTGGQLTGELVDHQVVVLSYSSYIKLSSL